MVAALRPRTDGRADERVLVRDAMNPLRFERAAPSLQSPIRSCLALVGVQHTTQYSPGRKAFYLCRRATGEGRGAALRRLANKLLGQLDHCLTHRVPTMSRPLGPTRNRRQSTP
jgi:hypothetical protein